MQFVLRNRLLGRQRQVYEARPAAQIPLHRVVQGVVQNVVAGIRARVPMRPCRHTRLVPNGGGDALGVNRRRYGADAVRDDDRLRQVRLDGLARVHLAREAQIDREPLHVQAGRPCRQP